MKKTVLVCLTALALLSATPTVAPAQGGRSDAARTGKVLTRLREARAEDRRVAIKFKSGARIVGKVGELRERGFTFEPDGLGPELRRQNAAAVILYEDLASVQYPSKVKSFFKKVGYGLALGGASVIVAPIYGVAILLGGCPPPC